MAGILPVPHLGERMMLWKIGRGNILERGGGSFPYLLFHGAVPVRRSQPSSRTWIWWFTHDTQLVILRWWSRMAGIILSHLIPTRSCWKKELVVYSSSGTLSVSKEEGRWAWDQRVWCLRGSCQAFNSISGWGFFIWIIFLQGPWFTREGQQQRRKSQKSATIKLWDFMTSWTWWRKMWRIETHHILSLLFLFVRQMIFQVETGFRIRLHP